MALPKLKITSKAWLLFVALLYAAQSFGLDTVALNTIALNTMAMPIQTEQSSESGCHGSGHAVRATEQKSKIVTLKCCSKNCNMASCHPVGTITSIVLTTFATLSSRQVYPLLESRPSTMPSSLYRPPIVS